MVRQFEVAPPMMDDSMGRIQEPDLQLSLVADFSAEFDAGTLVGDPRCDRRPTAHLSAPATPA